MQTERTNSIPWCDPEVTWCEEGEDAPTTGHPSDHLRRDSFDPGPAVGIPRIIAERLLSPFLLLSPLACTLDRGGLKPHDAGQNRDSGRDAGIDGQTAEGGGEAGPDAVDAMDVADVPPDISQDVPDAEDVRDAQPDAEIDIDGDGIEDDSDNCRETPNPDQLDTDTDGIGDLCDEDLDGDGVINGDDNCLDVPNPAPQSDIDADGIGDECDYAPYIRFPGDGLTLAPTRAFLRGMIGATPLGKTILSYRFCWTTGGLAAIGDAGLCPHEWIIEDRPYIVIDPLAPNITSYLWKMQACYDDGTCSDDSRIGQFSTNNAVVAWYRLDGNTADSSGNGHDGILMNNPFPVWPDGRSLLFDGLDDYIDLGATFPDTMEDAGTILARVNRVRNSGGIFSRNLGDSWVGQRLVTFLHEDANRWGWSLANGASGQEQDFSAFPAMTETDLALSWDGTTVAAYLSGLLLDRQGQTVRPEVTGLSTWIGRNDLGISGPYFDGSMNEVVICNQALPPEDLENKYCAFEAEEEAGPLPPLCE